jgi:hypothetical protein
VGNLKQHFTECPRQNKPGRPPRHTV